MCFVIDSEGRYHEATRLIGADPAWCEDFLRLKVQGRVVVKSCDRRFFHDGRHRAADGSTWQSGAKDYLQPPPDED